MTAQKKLQVGGQLWLAAATSGSISQRRIELLEAIDGSGSISQAARDIGMSYKAAWDAVDAINNLADGPLVQRSVGGRNGGGTRLTQQGSRLVKVYRAAEAEFRGFLSRLDRGVTDFEQFHELMKGLGMQTSARNEFAGRVTAITGGAVNSEVVLDIGGEKLVAVITNASVARLGLEVGVAAYALVKAPWVILTASEDLRSSARNCLCGEVVSVEAGAVNSEVSLRLAGGKILTAIVTAESVTSLGLAPGARVCALVKASHVIVAVGA